jgi:lipopolysaccharide transport system permease protein
MQLIAELGAPDRREAAGRHPLETGLSVSHPGVLIINMWRYRQLLGHLITRNLKSQYKQSLLGYLWIFVNPVVLFFVYDFVFSTILKTPSEGGLPFALFLFVGLVPWLFFSNAVGSATDSIIGGGSLVTVVHFPRELLVVAAIATRIVDWLAGIAILVPLLLYFHQPVTLTVFWLLPLFVLYVLFTLGVSLPLAALNLYFHDVRYLVGIGLLLWFFLSPVLYSMTTVPAKYLPFYKLNPQARFINSMRYTLLQGGSPPLTSLLLALAIAVLTLALGYYLFKRMEPGFADRI